MNVSESERLSSGLDQLGYEKVKDADDADIVILNSCVVRQGAEDKVTSRLDSLKGHKRKNPDATIALMGCMVGPNRDELRNRFPYVDVFMKPQVFDPLITHVGAQLGIDTDGCAGPFVPVHPKVATYVPIIHGCDKFCTFCIIPYRRGRASRSRFHTSRGCDVGTQFIFQYDWNCFTKGSGLRSPP